jgi:RNase adaptor protein for sRNA GlmZ degradation
MDNRRHQMSLDVDPNRVDITIFLHSFGYSKGGVHSIRSNDRHPVALSYLIDARLLPRAHLEPELRALDGTDSRVVIFLNRRGALDDLVMSEVSILADKIDLWVGKKIANFNVGIGSKYGRHRAVAVQELLARQLAKILTESYRLKVRIICKSFGDVRVMAPENNPEYPMKEASNLAQQLKLL